MINPTSVNQYIEAPTNTTTPPAFASVYYFDTKIQATFAWYDQIFEKQQG